MLGDGARPDDASFRGQAGARGVYDGHSPLVLLTRLLFSGVRRVTNFECVSSEGQLHRNALDVFVFVWMGATLLYLHDRTHAFADPYPSQARVTNTLREPHDNTTFAPAKNFEGVCPLQITPSKGDAMSCSHSIRSSS